LAASRIAPLTAHRNLSALVTCHTLYVVLTTWQSAVFLVNSRLTHFTATRCILATHSVRQKTEIRLPVWMRFVRLRRTNDSGESPKCSGHPFFRSYGARLPSSLTRFHSRALAQLCPPTCVGFRYGQPWEHPEVFLGSCFNGSASAEASTSLPLRADRHFQSATHFHRNVTSELNHSRCRNIKPAVHRLRPSAST
jgi:hypothetical protein